MCVAAYSMGGPATDMAPRTSKIVFTTAWGRKLRWVNMRWYPIVWPKPASVYIAANNTRSDQWTARCQSNQIARIVPRKGTTTITKTYGLELPISFIKPPLLPLPSEDELYQTAQAHRHQTAGASNR